MKPTVAIIGAGFSGMMTAAHLCQKSETPIRIFIINAGGSFGRGIAFHPYSELHLLNVMAGKMSAYPDDPDHFVNWLLTQPAYKKIGKDLISKTYLPRRLYGAYLDQVWSDAVRLKKEGVEIIQLNDRVINIQREEQFILQLEKSKPLTVDHVVLATGNAVPGPPAILNMNFYESKDYFEDPWSRSTVENLASKNDVLIIGNGLTMVDTVLGLREAGFTKKIYSISPDGFAILQHRHNGLSYPSMLEELKEPYHLKDLVNLFNRHRKAIRTLGLSAEPVIDSMRPITQAVWIALSVEEKKEFMNRLRHMWGVARHRLPIHVHDRIVRMKLDGNLLVRAGKILDIQEKPDGIQIDFYNKKLKAKESIRVERVINCTGPEADISKSKHELLRNLWKGGLLVSDPLKLGAMADPHTYEALDRQGQKIDSLFMIGTILRGLLWESTAVPEIRGQAQRISNQILKKMSVLQAG